MTYYMTKRDGNYLRVIKVDDKVDESQFQPFPTDGLTGNYDDFFMYDNNIISKNETKLLGFVGFRNRVCT